LLLAGSAVQAEPLEVQEPFRIGAILPLTGPLASLGTGSRKGIEMAVEALNSAGGISGRALEVLYEDSMGDPKTGLAAFMRMRPALNVPIVISGLTSVSQALKKVADREKILVFAESSLEGILDDSELMMRNFTDSKTFYGGMRRDLLSRGIRKIAVVRAQEEWAQGALDALVSSGDLQVVEEVAVSADTVDVKPYLAKLRSQEGSFDALVLVLLGSVQGTAINQLHQFPVKAPLFTVYLCSQPTLREVVKDRFNEGISFEGDRDSEAEIYQRFLSKFRARYSQSEPEFSALSQYDTVMFVAEALRAGMQTAVEIQRFITTKREFKGLLGATTFDSKGDAVHAAIPMRYKDGVCREVE
jgi:branched-chain amino acid transport system substrate-binding protein